MFSLPCIFSKNVEKCVSETSQYGEQLPTWISTIGVHLLFLSSSYFSLILTVPGLEIFLSHLKSLIWLHFGNLPKMISLLFLSSTNLPLTSSWPIFHFYLVHSFNHGHLIGFLPRFLGLSNNHLFSPFLLESPIFSKWVTN